MNYLKLGDLEIVVALGYMDFDPVLMRCPWTMKLPLAA